MNKEIELKARVDKPEELRKRLVKLYGESYAVKKDDIYYLYRNVDSSERGQSVRLRVENCKSIVTAKKKSISCGIETNDELEFSVDNGENFLKFLKMTGAEEWIKKSKNGWKFLKETGAGNAVIELCEVSSLGWFLEIEIVVVSPDASAVEDAREQLFSILHETGITEDRIESRFYSEMLLDEN